MEIKWQFYHGFWGLPSDWNALISCLGLKKSEYELIDLRKNNQAMQRSFNNWNLKIEENKKQIFVGYSLGGRLLSQFFHNHPNLLTENIELILISSGYGLQSEVERVQRRLWEDSILNKIEEMNLETFKIYWNSLDIFNGSKTINTQSDWTKNELHEIFSSYRLSDQKYIKDFISDHPQISVFLGEKDSKYRSLYKNTKYHTVEQAGHRVLSDEPKALAGCIQNIINKRVSL